MLERRGEAIRFHPTLLGFAGYYRYEPRPVAIGRGNEKGRVERAIRYVRDLALERQREQQGGEPPVAIVMPAHVRDRDAPVRPHALETYDQLKDQHDATRSDD